MKEFKKELKELLKKYDVSICFTCGEHSDTYGLYDDRLIVYSNKDGTKEERLSEGWDCGESDL